MLFKNAGLKNGEVMDLLCENGYIKCIGKDLSSDQVIDLEGKLLLPAFIDPHIHLDKVNIVDVVRPNISGTLKEAIEIIWDKKSDYTNEDIIKRGSEVIDKAISNGTLYMRTHVDVDNIVGLKALEGLVELRKKYDGIVDIQIVAFPQEGIIKNPGCEDLMWQAMKMGADIVGGMPANENSPEDSKKHIEICFEIAKAFDADIDMHVDETDDPFYRTLEMLADETLKCEYYNRVTAGHTCALAAYDDHYANYVMDKVQKAGIHMITNPVTNLLLQGRSDRQPIRRGITRVKELLERDILVSYGQDCVRDTFYPFGSADMLQVGLITAHAAQMSLPDERDKIIEMITNDAAKILRLDNYGLVKGAHADFVVIDASHIDEALSLQPSRLYVVRKGKIIYREMKTHEKMY